MQMAQQVHQKMLSITNQQGNTNLNYNEISSDTFRMAIMKKD